MDIKNIITSKNAQHVFNSVVSDISNLSLEALQELFSETKKHFSPNNLFQAIINCCDKLDKTHPLNSFLQNEANVLFDMVYQNGGEKAMKNLLHGFDYRASVVRLMNNSNLNHDYKGNFFRNVLNNIYVASDDTYYGIAKDVAIAYEQYNNFHLNNRNFYFFELGANKALLKNMIQNSKFVEDVKKLNDDNKEKMLKFLCTNSKVTVKEFEVIISPLKETLINKLHKLTPLNLGVNGKTFSLYKKCGIKLKDVLAKHNIANFANNYKKSDKEVLLKKLKEENVNTLFKEANVYQAFTKDKDIIIYTAQNNQWLDLKNTIEFKNKSLSNNENFLILTQKIIAKLKNKSVEDNLSSSLATLEKEIFNEKIVNTPSSTKKLKI